MSKETQKGIQSIENEEVRKKIEKASTGGDSPIIISNGGATGGKGYTTNLGKLTENIDGKLPSLTDDNVSGKLPKDNDAVKYGGTSTFLVEEPKRKEEKKSKLQLEEEDAKTARKTLKKKEAKKAVLDDYIENNSGKDERLKGYKDQTPLPIGIGGPGGILPIGLGGPGGSNGSRQLGGQLPIGLGGPGGSNGSRQLGGQLPIGIGVPGGGIRTNDEKPKQRKKCSDRKALNFDEFCISDRECCIYESELRDPIVCSDIEKSNIRIKMNSIDSEIMVLEQRKTEIENQNEYIPVVEDDTPSGTKYSNLTSNNVAYTTLPAIEKYTKDGVYVRSTVLSIEGNTNQSTESKGNPDYSDSTKWNAYVEEKLGSVYFKLNVDGDEDAFRIDNHSQGDDADFYREFCLAKGYEYDYFVKTNGKLKYSSKGLKGASIYCVDTEFIVTDDVADVKMVFAASQWDGFLLPKSDESEVKITMDVMVKFDADVIIDKCLAESEVPYIDLNTQYDSTNCNIVVFTDEVKNKEVFRQTKKRSQIIDSETKQINWIYDDENIEIWDRNGLQVEPTKEFCERVGAKLYNTKNLYVKQSRQYYDDTKFNKLVSNELYSEYRKILSNNINDYSTLVKELSQSGYSVKMYQYPKSNYNELINTQNVCKVDTPLLNEGYTTMVQEYGVMIKQLYDLDDTLDFCIARFDVLTKEINVLNTEKKKFAALLEEKRESISKKKKELRVLDVTYSETKKNNDELIKGSKNNTDRSRYKIKASEDQALYEKQRKELEIGLKNLELDIVDIKECLENLSKQIDSIEEERKKSAICKDLRDQLIIILENLISDNDDLTKKTKSLYDSWEKAIEATYRLYLEKTIQNVDDYLEGTNIDLSLEVDNSVGVLVTDKVYKYTKLWSYSKEDIWRFDKTKSYSGILLDGSEANVNLVKRNVGGAETLFNPLWQKLTLVLTREQCEQLKLCYPDKQFFIGLTINNPKNCQTTLLVDNIQIDTEANYVNKLYSTTLPPSFKLTPVIDDKKSWTYSDGGVTTGDTKMMFTKPQERSQSGMEYRYTDYTTNHSKLVVNSKETTFRIDPSNAVECDVYGFWQEMDCDTCDTSYSCSTGTTLAYTNPTGGTIGLTGTVVTSSFNCNEISNQLKTNNENWRDKVYNATNSPDLAKSISFTSIKESEGKPKSNQKVSKSPYVNAIAKNSGLIDVGVSSYTPKKLDSGFDTQNNQCGTTIIEIKNDDSTYTLIGEELDGSLGFYKYSADTNVVSEVTSFIDEECCLRVSRLINDEFKLSKPNYKWGGSKCIWNETASITDSCDSDCSYFGSEPIKTDYISTGTSLTATCTDTPVCIKPLDYLDKAPNDVNIKPQFDEMVIANLIDAKSRQVISGYPMLQLFYNQYMEASGCGVSLTNRLGTETVFEVMDLIGDYWSDVIEQVIPSTTIWDGNKNSGKLYRNTIFEQTKFPYTRYAMNYDTSECDITDVTDYHIGVNTGSTIDVTSYCIKGNCLGDNTVACNAEYKTLNFKKKSLEDKIESLKGILDQIDGKNKKEDTEELIQQKEQIQFCTNSKAENYGKACQRSGPCCKVSVIEDRPIDEEVIDSDVKVLQYCQTKAAINHGLPCQRTGPCCRMPDLTNEDIEVIDEKDLKDAKDLKDKADKTRKEVNAPKICTDFAATNYNEACHSITNCCMYLPPKAAYVELCEDVKAENYGEPCHTTAMCCKPKQMELEDIDAKLNVEDAKDKSERLMDGYKAEETEEESDELDFDIAVLDKDDTIIGRDKLVGDATRESTTNAGYGEPNYANNGASSTITGAGAFSLNGLGINNGTNGSLNQTNNGNLG